MVKTIARLAAFAVIAASALCSCASMDQALMLAPIVAEYPVSASPSLLVGERVLKADELKAIKPFKYDMLVPVKITQKRYDLDLSKDLVALIRDNKGKAITELKITTKDVRNGSIPWISLERYMGIMIMATGASYAYQFMLAPQSLGASTSGDKALSNGLLWGSLGTGALFIGGSFLHQSLATATYSLQIEGKVVDY